MISIFSGHQLTSSKIRGIEMAEYLGAKFNPEVGEGVCIHVKPKSLDKVKNGDYVDFLDSDPFLIDLLKSRTRVKVIAASQCSYETLVKQLPNEVVLIPSHHINQERKKRTRTEVNTCGYIGRHSPEAVAMYDEIAKELNKVGFNFTAKFSFPRRQDAVNLYMGIDLFVIGNYRGDDSPHKIPTKVINAASFGIPTVAYPLRGYKEIEGYYVPAKDNSELVAEVVKFKDQDYYSAWSAKVSDFAEQYHISKIAEMYRRLT